jgi:hypothetical protein
VIAWLRQRRTAWLRATVKVRFDLADKPHREFLAAKFGDLLFLTGSAEQEPLSFEPAKE